MFFGVVILTVGDWPFHGNQFSMFISSHACFHGAHTHAVLDRPECTASLPWVTVSGAIYLYAGEGCNTKENINCFYVYFLSSFIFCSISGRSSLGRNVMRLSKYELQEQQRRLWSAIRYWKFFKDTRFKSSFSYSRNIVEVPKCLRYVFDDNGSLFSINKILSL